MRGRQTSLTMVSQSPLRASPQAEMLELDANEHGTPVESWEQRLWMMMMMMMDQKTLEVLVVAAKQIYLSWYLQVFRLEHVACLSCSKLMVPSLVLDCMDVNHGVLLSGSDEQAYESRSRR